MQTVASANALPCWRFTQAMTLLDLAGVYVGWDETGPLMSLSTYRGSIQVQVGQLLVGCDWFFNHPDDQLKPATPAGTHGRCDLEGTPNP